MPGLKFLANSCGLDPPMRTRTTREEGQQQQSWRVIQGEAINGVTGLLDHVLQGKSWAKPGWLTRMANTCKRGGLRYVCRVFLG
jgi:hypothetical protein